VARVRLTRRRLNPIPGTRSTQSRYFLGYFIFVDEPDVGYAVAIRAAAPPKTAGLIKQRALVKAETAAQKLSDKTGRQVAFMPLLPQASKYEAVEHLYGGKGSRRYGGPNARGSVTLSRSRLPNRAVNQTALKSVQAHWASLYGPGKVGQRGWPRATKQFRTAAAYSVEDGALRFSPYAEPPPEERVEQQVTREEAARVRDRITKLERLARDQVGMPEGESAQSVADRLRQRLGDAVDDDGLDIPAILDEVELEDTMLNRAWVKGLADMMEPDDQTESEIAYIGGLFLSFIDSVARQLRRAGKPFSPPEALRLLQTTSKYQDTRNELARVGIRTGRQQSTLLRRSLQVLQAEGDMPAA